MKEITLHLNKDKFERLQKIYKLLQKNLMDDLEKIGNKFIEDTIEEITNLL